MRRVVLVLTAALALAGCETYRPANPEDVARARYVSDAPPSVTLVSMVNNRSGRSAHVGLLINGSQQVLYDPAGTFSHPDLPRRDDVHYGMTPRFVDYYERYHARFSHFVEAQQVPISRAAADQLIANAKAEGKILKAHCALAIADVLRPVPPFDNVTRSYFPEGLRQDFAAMPGVRTSYVREVDVGKNRDWERSAAAQPEPIARRGRRAYISAINPRGAMGEPEPPLASAPMVATVSSQGRRISSILEALPHAVKGDRISFGDLIDAFEQRAYGPLIVVFAAPNMLPVALPGLSAVLGVLLMLLTAQLMLGLRRPWLPGFLRRRSIARSSFEAMVARIVPRLRRIERMVSPRLLVLTGVLGKRLIGAFGVVLALIIMLPVPFGNGVPGLALILMSVGLLGRDGLAVLAGSLLGAGWLVVASGLVYGAVMAGLALVRGGLGI